jgi:hypothetical protein
MRCAVTAAAFGCAELDRLGAGLLPGLQRSIAGDPGSGEKSGPSLASPTLPALPGSVTLPPLETARVVKDEREAVIWSRSAEIGLAGLARAVQVRYRAHQVDSGGADPPVGYST